MNCVIQYSEGGRLLNFYTQADSIEQAEAKAARWGIVGDGFEIVEVIDA
jgi:hypothetical protein